MLVGLNDSSVIEIKDFELNKTKKGRILNLNKTKNLEIFERNRQKSRGVAALLFKWGQGWGRTVPYDHRCSLASLRAPLSTTPPKAKSENRSMLFTVQTYSEAPLYVVN
jgi:exoribonuclease R